MNYTYAKQIADYLALNLAEYCLPGYCQAAGSVRRKKAECGDLELVVIPGPGHPRPEFGQKRIFSSYLDQGLYRMECDGRLGRRIKDGERYKQIVIRTEALGVKTLNDFCLDLFIVRPETWGIQFTLRTGPADFSHKCVTPRTQGGYLPNDCKYIVGETRIERGGITLPLPEEQDFLTLLGLGWIEPENRK